jgi:anti-sigma factor RsiW
VRQRSYPRRWAAERRDATISNAGRLAAVRPDMNCPRMSSLGAYVVGALDDAERAQVDAHLATCADCRDELERLMPLPRYLASIPSYLVRSPNPKGYSGS